VKRASIKIAPLLLLIATATAQPHYQSHSTILTFSVDGKKLACTELRIEFVVGQRKFKAHRTELGFDVPPIIETLYADENTRKRQDISVNISCDQYAVSFSDLAPGLALPGYWDVGIAHPPSWFEVEAGTIAPTSMWQTYLSSDCYHCDPGIITSESHSEVPTALMRRYLEEQPTASGTAARDIAYSLAVFHVEPDRNRNYLVELFGTCLSRPKNSPEDDVCNSRLLEYLTNLYERGDEGLLAPLLQAAESRKDVVDDIGNFYAQMLDHQPATLLKGLETLSAEKQQFVCNSAGADDIRFDPPKLERVTKNLLAADSDAARRCLNEVKLAASR